MLGLWFTRVIILNLLVIIFEFIQLDPGSQTHGFVRYFALSLLLLNQYLRNFKIENAKGKSVELTLLHV